MAGDSWAETKAQKAPAELKHTVRCRSCGKTGHNSRTCPGVTAADLPPPIDIAKRKEEIQRRAIENPCRDPKCHIERLHVAHATA